MNVSVDPARSSVVLVDYQQRLLPAIHLGEHAVGEAARLADCARLLGIRVVGTEQNPRGLGPNTAAIKERCDYTLAKMHFDGCADGLVDALHLADRPAPSHAIVAGCETHVCLMQTALGLRRAGLRVWVAANACGTRRPADHELALRRMDRSGIVPVSVEMIVFEWLRTCEHPRFREVLAVLKTSGG